MDRPQHLLADPVEDLEAIGTRHLQIEEEQQRQRMVALGEPGLQVFDRLRAVLPDVDLRLDARLREGVLGQSDRIGVVIDDENGTGARSVHDEVEEDEDDSGPLVWQ